MIVNWTEADEVLCVLAGRICPKCGRGFNKLVSHWENDDPPIDENTGCPRLRYYFTVHPCECHLNPKAGVELRDRTGC